MNSEKASNQKREPPDAHQILLWISLPMTKVEKVSTNASDLQF